MQPRHRNPLKSFVPWLIVLLLLAALSGISTLHITHAHAASSISNDTTNQLVTMTGDNYTMVFDYHQQARVSSFIVHSQQLLDTSTNQGFYSAVYTGSSWVTTQTLSTNPVVQISGNVVTATFTTSVATEVWTFTVAAASVQFQIARTYTSSITLAQQGTPMLNFAEHALDNIRWPDDGGNFPVDGSQLDTYQSDWLATGTQLDSNIHASKEQIDYVLVNTSEQLALNVTGVSNHDTVNRGHATELSRTTNNNLRLAVMTSASGLQYSSGSSLGYSTNDCDGHVTCNGQEVFQGVTATSGQTDQVTLTFTPASYATYYSLGTLNGVDANALSQMINDYGRWMMQDTQRGASTEASILKTEVPPLEMQWLGQLLELFPDPNATTAFKNGLNDIKTYLVDSGTGKILCCRPLTGDYWGANYYDQAPGFALGVVEAYNLSGDKTWLQGIQSTVEGGLNYEITNDTNATSRLVLNHQNAGPSVSDNDYWESSTGTYNGYTSALLYSALTQWATLESQVLNNASEAAYYNGIAATLQTSFNQNVSAGGFWSPTTNTFLYGSGNQDVSYLPVESAVLKSGIATRSRDLQIAQAVENITRANNADYHYMNYNDLYTANTPAPACAKSGENGGWYGAPDGDFYSGLPLLNDPTLIPGYIGNFTTRYYADGFYGSSAWSRSNPYSGCGYEHWFPTQIMPIWGLYHYAYGFQPQANQLVFAPFISQSMVGSVVNYTWRGQPITVTYNSQTSFTINAPNLQTNIAIDWINQTPGATYHNQVDGGTSYAGTADSNGTFSGLFNARDAGSHTFNCTDCSVVSTPGLTGNSLVTSWNPGSATLRNNASNSVGMQFTTGSTPITVTALGREYISGNTRLHPLKLVDSSGHILASTIVNMSNGTADSNGFKYGVLQHPVTLAAHTTYYLYSTESNGGDQWYDYATNISTTSVAAINNAVYGLQTNLSSLNSVGGSGNSYDPLNFLYQ